MTVRHIQYVLASVFFILGGWCLVSPSSVLALCVTPRFSPRTPSSRS